MRRRASSAVLAALAAAAVAAPAASADGLGLVESAGALCRGDPDHASLLRVCHQPPLPPTVRPVVPWGEGASRIGRARSAPQDGSRALPR